MSASPWSMFGKRFSGTSTPEAVPEDSIGAGPTPSRNLTKAEVAESDDEDFLHVLDTPARPRPRRDRKRFPMSTPAARKLNFDIAVAADRPPPVSTSTITGSASTLKFESRESLTNQLLHEVLKDDKKFFYKLTAFGTQLSGVTGASFWKTHSTGYDELFALAKQGLERKGASGRTRMPVVRFLSEAEVPFRAEDLHAFFANHLTALLNSQETGVASLGDVELELYTAQALAEAFSQINHTRRGEERRIAIQVVPVSKDTIIRNAVHGVMLQKTRASTTTMTFSLLAAQLAKTLADSLSKAENLQAVIYDEKLIPDSSVNALGMLNRMELNERRARVLSMISDGGSTREDAVLTHMIDARSMAAIQQTRIHTGVVSLEAIVESSHSQKTLFIQLVAANYALNTAQASSLTSTRMLVQLRMDVAAKVQVYKELSPYRSTWATVEDQLSGTKRARLLEYTIV